MKLEVVTTQIDKTSWVHPVLDKYRIKIKPFYPIEIRWLKSKNRPRKDSVLAVKENEKLFLEASRGRCYKISFDERGQSLDSLKFSRKLCTALESGKDQVQFFVGGPFGLGKKIIEDSDVTISLSTLVFNQEIALAVVAEQIYRALTIRGGLPYHNE